MNRLQSKDFETYSRLTHGSKVDFEQLPPMTDMEELRRLTAANGVGDHIYESDDAGDDSEFRDTLSEFGFSVE